MLLNDLNYLTFIPVVTYNDAYSIKINSILENENENETKAGVYC